MKSVASARATIPHSKKPFEKKETKLLRTAEIHRDRKTPQ